MATQKFRPVLTAEQINHLVTTLKDIFPAQESDHEMNQSILRVLVPFQAKISIGAVSASYSISPESEQKRLDIEMRNKYNDGLMTPEEESRYEKDILGI